MDKPRRDNLRQAIQEARRILEEDLKARLAHYGLSPEREAAIAVSRLPLSDGDLQMRQKLENAVEHERGGRSWQDGARRFQRSAAFTFLNRLAALRAMEVRGLLSLETVRRRSEHGGRSRRELEIAHRYPGLSEEEILRRSLKEAFDEVSQDVRFLFDPADPYVLLWPSYAALKRVVELISDRVPDEDWREDDAIGWVYQYYIFREERDSIRQEAIQRKSRPLDPDDVHPINCFYTPRWIVRFLTDNTLGRLWLEMHPESSLKDKLAYLVPLPGEQPTRDPIPVEDLKVLDPACGSGHFLVYAFELLFHMWKEAHPELSATEIASGILARNLYGIDIDRRACQLAALSLYLKAKCLAPAVKVRQMNIVSADAYVTADGARKALIDRFAVDRQDKELQQLISRILEELQDCKPIGSLFRIREEFDRLFARRKGELPGLWWDPAGVLEEIRRFEAQAAGEQNMGQLLFGANAERAVGLAWLLLQQYHVVLMNPPYGSVPPKTKEYLKQHFPRTHHDVYAAFLEQAVDMTVPGGFVGMLSGATFMYLRSFKALRREILGVKSAPVALLELGWKVLDEAAVRYAATAIRKAGEGAQPSPSLNNICMFCRLTAPEWDEKRLEFESSLVRLKMGQGNEGVWYADDLRDLLRLPEATYAYWASHSLRENLVKYPPLDRDVAMKPEAPKIADVRMGLATKDDLQFVRSFWEVNPDDVGRNKVWAPYAKGGELARYYADIPLIVLWQNRGEILKDFIVRRYPYLRGNWSWVVQSEDYYFRKGLTWSNISVTGKCRMRILPEGAIFGQRGQGVFPTDGDDRVLFGLLGVLNSALHNILLWVLTPERNWEVGHIGSLPISKGVLTGSAIAPFAREAHDLLREWDTGNEVSTIFIKPWLLQVRHGFNPQERPVTGHPFAREFTWADWESLRQIRAIAGTPEMSLHQLAQLCVQREEMMRARLDEIQRQIDEEVYRLYEISNEDRRLIERELALRQGKTSLVEEAAEEEAAEEEPEEAAPEPAVNHEKKIQDHIKRLLSFYARRAMEAEASGILTLSRLAEQVRQALAEEFGQERLDPLELEIRSILGSTVEEWLGWEFFPFHNTLYRRRPIVWQLTSFPFRKGRRKPPGAFNCFLYYHRLSSDTLRQVLYIYLKPALEQARERRDYLLQRWQEAKGQRGEEHRRENDYLEADATVRELEGFWEALELLTQPAQNLKAPPENARWVQQKEYEVRKEGWRPVLDYGVRVNIKALQDAGVLHPDARRIK